MSDLEFLRNRLKESSERSNNDWQLLKNLYDEMAKKVCPFNVGDVIEYEPGKKGIVDEIFFPNSAWTPLVEQQPDSWAVVGRKINKNGQFGKKNFQDVSCNTHVINGNVCRRMTFENKLGLEMVELSEGEVEDR